VQFTELLEKAGEASHPRRVLCYYGLNPFEDYLTEVGFEQQDLNLPPRTVLLTQGPVKYKRYDPDKLCRFYKHLESENYNVIVLMGEAKLLNKEREAAKYLIERGLQVREMEPTEESVVFYLSHLAQAAAYVGPDNGMLHAAMAIRNPTVYLETYYPAHLVMTNWDTLRVCRAKERCPSCPGCTDQNRYYAPQKPAVSGCIPGPTAVPCLAEFDELAISRHLADLIPP
jgi:ADP-heptose:LPS heptosyltransferase